MWLADQMCMIWYSETIHSALLGNQIFLMQKQFTRIINKIYFGNTSWVYLSQFSLHRFQHLQTPWDEEAEFMQKLTFTRQWKTEEAGHVTQDSNPSRLHHIHGFNTRNHPSLVWLTLTHKQCTSSSVWFCFHT